MHRITPGLPHFLTVSSSPVSAPAAEGVLEKSVLTWTKRLGLVMGCGNGEGGGGVLEFPDSTSLVVKVTIEEGGSL